MVVWTRALRAQVLRDALAFFAIFCAASLASYYLRPHSPPAMAKQSGQPLTPDEVEKTVCMSMRDLAAGKMPQVRWIKPECFTPGEPSGG